MLDPIQITVTHVRESGSGLLIECLWQWGEDEDPREVHVLTGDWPADVDEARAMVTAWVLNYAEDAYKVGPIRGELMQESWTITLDAGRDPFENGRAARSALLERTAGAMTRLPDLPED